ncbi:unnamed protein product [Polarella glacialis]|uniref:PA domain-containing protein n=1 Tax=Polarella glacialis TaxID=89957 RepID=A0A813J0T2_POLGL|nr:unnamed protein product [Polarella glacialis]
MQNFFNFNSLLFSFFVSQTYASLYQQQESLYGALFSEVSEARSLLEQLTLVSQNRPSYPVMLRSMQDYVEELILGVRKGCPPALLVAAKPENDPLENILYLTSVGVPSVVYETVRSLRQARGARLGATQRKLPLEHFVLLYVLGALELLVFPLLGAGVAGYEPAGTASLPGHVLWLQGAVFALLAGCIVLALQVVQDLRSPTAGLYSIDATLDEMVEGLREELDRRISAAPSLANCGLYQATIKDSSDTPEVMFQRLGLPFGSDNRRIMQDWPSFQPRGDEESSKYYLACCAGAFVLSFVLFFPMTELLRGWLSEPALQAIREDNNAQWLQNFFTGVGLIFSLFAAQTFGFLYAQQEAIYLALYSEVSEAKALLEQLALVCRIRPTYSEVLEGLRGYVQNDLRRIDVRPSRLLGGMAPLGERTSGEGGSEPLEAVLYITSVGVPSAVYETVKGLRQARGQRLAATQRKLPPLHFGLLAALSVLELSIFPVLGAGCMALEPTTAMLPGHITFFQALLFGLMASVLTLTFVLLRDLWDPTSGTYSMQAILAEMVSGLEEELEMRLKEAARSRDAPSGISGADFPVGDQAVLSTTSATWSTPRCRRLEAESAPPEFLSFGYGPGQHVSSQLLVNAIDMMNFAHSRVAEVPTSYQNGIEAAPLAVLRLDDGSSKGRSFPALIAEWSAKGEVEVDGLKLVRPEGDNAQGCSQIQRCRGCAIFVQQGKCPFSQKAKRAEAAGAKLLIVAMAADGPTVGMASTVENSLFGSNSPRITSVSVSKKTGRQVILAMDNSAKPILTSVRRRKDNVYADILSEVFVALLAVTLIMLGAWHSVEDLRKPEVKDMFNEACVAVEESSGLHFVCFGSLMLTVLFFFMKYLIYVLLFLFASGAVSTTTMLLEPIIAAWRPSLRQKKACKLPSKLAGLLGVEEDHTCSDAIAESLGGVLAILFLLYRNDDSYGWMLQDTIAVMLLLTIQRTLRLPNLKVGTLMLICTFFFDIFWVFLSPLIFKKSVMIEVATGGGTGQSVPMVLKIPSLQGDFPGQFKILGLGDIAIPGLLISLLLRHDLVKGYKRFEGYFTAGVIGYAVGLAATFVSLYLMQHGQPALLFLVPGTLVPTCLIALRKGELAAFWSASYGPEQPPEGYDSLAGDEEKRA